MSNEVGNKLYHNTLAQLQKMCKDNRDTKLLADFVVEKSASTQLFNLTNVFDKRMPMVCDMENHKIKEEYKEEETVKRYEMPEAVEEVSGYSASYVDKNLVNIKCNWEVYSDDVFLYFMAESKNTKVPNYYYVFLMHRLDDNRIISFYGLFVGEKLMFLESIPINVSLNGLDVKIEHLRNMLNSVTPYENETVDYFVMQMSIVLKMFYDLSNQNARKYKCFIDEDDDNRCKYLRKLCGNKQVVKVSNKPIILVLEDNKDTETNVQKYRTPRGKIHYAFSWIVRGHYRKLHDPESVGKDRNGERVVQGMTWVETYLKGDENLPLLKRETIVIDKRKNKCTTAV